MKKGLIAAGLLVSLSGTAQDVSTYTPGTMGEGVVYYLPKTEIELQVIATKVVYTPGEFCQYADRYLRLTGISSQPEEHWEINSIKVNSIGIPDPDNAYAVKLKDKSAASQVELTPEGIIKAINTTSPIEKAPVTKVADTAKKRIDPRSFMTEEILIAGSTAKMAELVAKEIYNIRESKNSLTRGQADYMPKDGAALKLMLDNLDEQEQAMMHGYFFLRLLSRFFLSTHQWFYLYVLSPTENAPTPVPLHCCLIQYCQYKPTGSPLTAAQNFQSPQHAPVLPPWHYLIPKPV